MRWWLGIAVVVAVVFPCTASAKRIWYEYGIGAVTAGVDVKARKTLVRKYYLAAVGPDSINDEVVGYAKECISTAMGVGAGAFYNNPDPAVAVRLAAGYVAFKASLVSCFGVRSQLKALAGEFTLSITNRAKWEDGVRVKFDVNSPMTKNYEQLNAWLKERTGIKGDGAKMLNKAFSLYSRSKEIHIDVELSKVPLMEANDWMSDLPKNGEQLLKDGAAEAARATQKLSDLAGKSIDVPESVARRIVNDPALQGLAKHAPIPYATSQQLAAQALRAAARPLPPKTKSTINDGLKSAGVGVRLP